jgi:hypothetical protein
VIIEMRTLLIILILSFTSTAWAKRIGAPPEIEVRFSNTTLRSTHNECGIIFVRRDSNPSKIERKRIYRVWYNPFLEKDVQNIWIKNMFLTGTTLWIRDEKNRIFTVGMKFGDVTRRKDVTDSQFEKLLKASTEQGAAANP